MTIKELRKEHNLTQVEAARRLRVSLQGYLTWEREVGTPNRVNMDRLIGLFGERVNDCFRKSV